MKSPLTLICFMVHGLINGMDLLLMNEVAEYRHVVIDQQGLQVAQEFNTIKPSPIPTAETIDHLFRGIRCYFIAYGFEHFTLSLENGERELTDDTLFDSIEKYKAPWNQVISHLGRSKTDRISAVFNRGLAHLAPKRPGVFDQCVRWASDKEIPDTSRKILNNASITKMKAILKRHESSKTQSCALL